MEKTVKQRLIEYLEFKKIGRNKFESMAGISLGYITHLKNSPGAAQLVKILTAAPDLSQQWLLTGEGSMLLGKSKPQEAPTPDVPSNAVPTADAIDIEFAGANHNDGIFFRDRNSGQLYISVPHVPFAARGEYANLADRLDPMGEWGREIYAVDRKANGRYISFDIRGDSMDNGMRRSLQDGDKVLVRELEHDNWRTLRTGDHRFWVLVFGSSVLIKEISSFDPATGIITCHSLNPSPEYHDFDVPLDTVRHLYYVIKIKPSEIDVA